MKNFDANTVRPVSVAVQVKGANLKGINVAAGDTIDYNESLATIGRSQRLGDSLARAMAEDMLDNQGFSDPTDKTTYKLAKKWLLTRIPQELRDVINPDGKKANKPWTHSDARSTEKAEGKCPWHDQAKGVHNTMAELKRVYETRQKALEPATPETGGDDSNDADGVAEATQDTPETILASLTSLADRLVDVDTDNIHTGSRKALLDTIKTLTAELAK